MIYMLDIEIDVELIEEFKKINKNLETMGNLLKRIHEELHLMRTNVRR